MYTVTINIAGRGTWLKNAGDNKPGQSAVGHMWYEISDGNGNNNSYGFAPDKTHHDNPFNNKKHRILQTHRK
ncbi:hypothetical protein D1605_011180 [Xylella fastidiosa subsp. fastidiosa]|jgi:hypothetical protein|uniref:Uncharacterized protein n=2 Tax=Xylella fastidiosa TaxID=2371 RepID=Q879U8_XYLFT|nr:hypothetical protein [Xylella fastidiosa]AAO29915.1 conserved hypothetical protein [Xylella fastidiosa Temecula1]ACB93594.1 hypothetical protein XfasM23_2199 [Xylella fastidiosa M23]MBE0263101.1 hypothetical protein [Xylella fastidiosa subsp. fastidiosa]MBE0265307.1 hypothetical protein [Xylella fastidiosa subsp. fastidiosa]MBE0265619.1 hypothetical protein [Xylella fastidiosa subsp. fastidiosa]